jgi:hypothetical protein
MSVEEMEKPDESLRINFYHMLHGEIKRNEAGKANQVKELSVHWYERSIFRVAAGFALLIAGSLIGMIIYSGFSGPGHAKELSQLKSEVTELRKTAMFTMLKDGSPSNRLQAVDYATAIDSPDDDIINAIVKTLNNDRNVNVRMAAAFALTKFTGFQSVRDSLVKSLSGQTDPIVQVTLINILVELREKSALKPIEQIISSDKTIQEVKKVAENGAKLLI